MHEQQQRAGGKGKSLLPAALVVHVNVDVEGGFQLLACPLPPRLLCEAHLLGQDGHYAGPPLCTTHTSPSSVTLSVM